MRRNVQATLAADLQALSNKFRRQQRGYLNKLRQREEGPGAAGSLGVLDEGPRMRPDDDFDLGYSEAQVSSGAPCMHPALRCMCWPEHAIAELEGQVSPTGLEGPFCRKHVKASGGIT